MRAMVPTTVRFTDLTHALIQREAEVGGIPMARFIREAALIRAALQLGARVGKSDELRERLREVAGDDETVARLLLVIQQTAEELSGGAA